MQSGIYCIRCLINDKRYIGSCINLAKRKKEHYDKLKQGTNTEFLQQDYDIHGPENFVFEIIEVLEFNAELFVELENYYMDLYETNAKTHNKGYNKNKAVLITEEQRKNLSNAIKGNTNSRKLSLQECQEIYDVLKDGKSLMKKYKQLSEQYNVSDKTIRNIKAGKHWSSKHMEG